MLNALFLEQRLRPREDGTVSLSELAAAMIGAGVDASQAPVLRVMAALGHGGAEAVVDSTFGTEDEFRVNLGFHLLEGALGHAADSGVLGQPPGPPRAERFEALIAHAEDRGSGARVMTKESYLAALDARADKERAHQGSAAKGRLFGALEAQLIPSIFGELTVDQLRAFYFEGKIPPALASQAGLGAALSAIVKRVPVGFVEDVKRALRGDGQ